MLDDPGSLGEGAQGASGLGANGASGAASAASAGASGSAATAAAAGTAAAGEAATGGLLGFVAANAGVLGYVATALVTTALVGGSVFGLSLSDLAAQSLRAASTLPFNFLPTGLTGRVQGAYTEKVIQQAAAFTTGGTQLTELAQAQLAKISGVSSNIVAQAQQDKAQLTQQSANTPKLTSFTTSADSKIVIDPPGPKTTPTPQATTSGTPIVDDAVIPIAGATGTPQTLVLVPSRTAQPTQQPTPVVTGQPTVEPTTAATVAATVAPTVVVLLLGLTAAPAALGYKTYVVLSGSMEPSIHTGAVIMALPVAPSTLNVGDVIVYNRTDVNETITHRIVERNDDGGKPTFVTKGDANGAPDAWTVQYSGNTAGKVLFSIPYVGYVNHALETSQGRLFFVVVPVLVLSIMWLVQIWRPKKAAGQQPAATPVPAPAEAIKAPPPVDLKANAHDRSAPLPLRQ